MNIQDPATQTVTPRALEGVKVVEMGQLIAGPFCGKTLGEFGADVIKIEAPGAGDPLRNWRLIKEGTSVWWQVQSRNKRSVALDLRQTEGQTIARQLIAEADVLVENFRPGTLEGWGMSPEELHAINPGLVILRISGYGHASPYLVDRKKRCTWTLSAEEVSVLEGMHWRLPRWSGEETSSGSMHDDGQGPWSDTHFNAWLAANVANQAMPMVELRDLWVPWDAVPVQKEEAPPELPLPPAGLKVMRPPATSQSCCRVAHVQQYPGLESSKTHETEPAATLS